MLFKADLTNACLFKANLYRANLEAAILKGADLEQAVLAEANLRYAILHKAKLGGPYYGRPISKAPDLNEVDGLEAPELKEAKAWVLAYDDNKSKIFKDLSDARNQRQCTLGDSPVGLWPVSRPRPNSREAPCGSDLGLTTSIAASARSIP